MSSYNPVLLAYDTFEPAEGEDYTLSPVIFLHGITASKAYWEGIPQRIADGTKRKVYSLDARNHGDSDWSDDFSFDIVSKDLDSFMDRHSIRRAVLVGHSMGGMASIKLALTKPERVEKLVVEDMMVRPVPQHLIDMVAGLIMLLQKCLDVVPEGASEDAARRAIIDFAFSHIPKTDKPLVKPENNQGRYLSLKKTEDGRYSFKGNLKAMLKSLKEYPEVTKAPEGKYEGPALFIYGTVSPFEIQNEEDSIRTHFPKAQLVGVEDATHLVHDDDTEQFTDAVLKFITS